ncbi:MAG TPA: PDZ domain-containing protein [Pyrinomonadaceae bacterium]|nr:PDZ domain-containing protein [Pyrinomonadaceae bacterium]
MSRKQLLISAGLALSLACGATAFAQSDAERREAETAARALSVVAGGNFLGVRTESVTRETLGRYNLSGEPRGVGVVSVVADSPAAKAGLQQGDVILRFDGEPVSSPQKLQRLISEAAPGHAARLTVSRAGSEREFTATLVKREGASALGLLRTPDGQEFRWNDEEWKKRAEELQRYNREWQQNGEEWRKRSEELRRQFENMPRGNFTFFNAGRRIGVSTTALTEQLADYFGVSERRGLLVNSVSENSPAAKAGIKAGDVIVEAEGEKVSSAGELSRAINRKETGEVAITIVRDRNRRTIRVTPEKSESPRTFVVPEGLFAPSVGGLNLTDTLTGPGRVIQLPEMRRLTPMRAPRLDTLPRVIVPQRSRESVIL